MKFRSAYSDSGRYYSPSGDGFRKKYVKQKNPDGTSVLLEDGIENVYDSIQKAGLGLAIDDLIRRAKAGDTEAIPEVVDSYVDIRKAPKDLLEANKMLADARSKYESLPAELRSKYDNNFNTFLEAASSGEALKVASDLTKAKVKPKPTLTADEINALKAQLKSGGKSSDA